MTTAHYQALVQEPALVSGFDENPYQKMMVEGIIPVPSHIPQEGWTVYCLREIVRRYRDVPERLILIVMRNKP